MHTSGKFILHNKTPMKCNEVKGYHRDVDQDLGNLFTCFGEKLTNDLTPEYIDSRF